MAGKQKAPPVDFHDDDVKKVKVLDSRACGMRNFIHQCLHTAQTASPGGPAIPGVPTGKYYSEISCANFVQDGPAFANEIDKEIFHGSAEWLPPCEMTTPSKNVYLIPAKLKLTIFTDMCVAPFSAPCCA